MLWVHLKGNFHGMNLKEAREFMYLCFISFGLENIEYRKLNSNLYILGTRWIMDKILIQGLDKSDIPDFSFQDLGNLWKKIAFK